LLGRDDAGDKLFGGGLRRRGCNSGDDVLDVVDMASRRCDEEVFGESAGYAASGCREDLISFRYVAECSEIVVISHTHDAPTNSKSIFCHPVSSSDVGSAGTNVVRRMVL